MIIDHCPRSVQAFFTPLRKELSKPQFAHLWMILLALAAHRRRAKLCQIERCLPDGTHRTSHGLFLRRAPWDAQKAMEDRALGVLRSMKPQHGETLYLIIDDTRIEKRGQKMAHVRKIWDHTQKRFIRGHILVTAALRFRGVVLPWKIRIWKPSTKTTSIAAEMIESLRPPRGLKVRVLFDAFYLCPQVTTTCKNHGFTWFSVAAKNRSFKRDRGRRKKLGALVSGWLTHQGQSVRLRRSRGTRSMRVAQIDGHLSRIGRVRLAVSKRPNDPWKNILVVVTNETRLSARSILCEYERRWSIEVLFKELKGELGLGDYQVLEERGIVRHLHLCGLAHLMLTHHALRAVGAQATQANTEAPLPTIKQRAEDLRRDIQQDQVRRALSVRSWRECRQKVEKYLLAA